MKKLFALFTTLVLSLPVFSQVSPAALATFITARGDSLYKAAKIPGLFVAVLNGSERTFYNFGYAVPDEKIPFDSATIFEAGSISKTFTALVVQKVLEQFGISDTSTIAAWLPDPVRQNKAVASITFLSLLNHTSGLPRLPANLPTNNAPYDNYTTADLFAFLKSCTPKPDGKSNYSNLGMGLAGVLAQRITGKTFEALSEQYIFDPFGIQLANRKTRRRAQGYMDTAKQAFWNMNALAPAGGLRCNAKELLIYLETMSKPPADYEATVTRLLAPTVSISPVMSVAKGWHIFQEAGKPEIYWHNGGTYGFSTFAAFLKNTNQAVVVVINKFNSNAISDALGIAIMKKLRQQ